MNINVLKFGGSSVANNTNLNIVAKKIIDFKNKEKDIVVIVSAQGNMTDNLIKEANELSATPDERELDALINVGEQITASKLSILLNRLGHKAISLNGWQAGIKTNNNFQKAKIIDIDTTKIITELEKKKIVIITGFQGIDNKGNITTLGRGGSDTSAVAIASVLNAEHCYIFSDVDGVYTSDPSKVNNAEKLKSISFKEMQLASNEGAKVLHDRCVELAEKYNTKIVASSTFNKHKGTLIESGNNNIEENKIKSIVKNDDILLVKIVLDNEEKTYSFLKSIAKSKIKIGYYKINKNIINLSILNKDRFTLIKLIDKTNNKISVAESSKVSIIGTGISNNFELIEKIINVLNIVKKEILFIDISAYKLSIQFTKKINDEFLQELHTKIIK
ncbi:MAG: aspartate kinase [Clostridia bacterium]|nr:aspartate kinase [Clostridia bacterium]